MATRSTIALEFADGTVQQVYCHWDGYLANNGKLLLENYMDPFKVRDLIDLGDISSLRPEIGVAHPFSKWDTEMTPAEYEAQFANMTTFYGRDRNESGVGPKKFADFQDYAVNHQPEEYEYILRTDGNWYVQFYKSGENYVLLTEAFEMEKETEEV